MTAPQPNPWTTFADLLDPPEHKYARDPVGWARDVLGMHLWSLQAEVARSVAANKRTAVQAGHGVGKSLVATVLTAWWVMTHPVSDVLVITTAPTDDQVKTVLWRELMMLHEKAGLPGRITLDAKWHIGGNLVAFGRKPADHRSSALQGHHAKYLLTIGDEASGIQFPIWDQLASLTSNANGRSLAIGNPTDPASHFAKMCKPGSGWVRHKISVLDSPNFTGEPVPDDMKAKLSDQSYLEDAIRDYGVGSPLYSARVLGEFPDISDDTLIIPKWIEAAQLRRLEPNGMPRLAIDVARFGSDESVIMRREGGWARVWASWRQQDTMATAGRVLRTLSEIHEERDLKAWPTAVIDEVGVGAGVLDRLLELGADVQGLNAGVPANDTEHYINLRAEGMWELRRIFEAGEVDIDPRDDSLAAQLGSIKWTVDSRGRTKIESKDDMRKRGLPSPDRADVLWMSFVENAGLAYDDDPVEQNRPKSIMAGVMEEKW